MNKLKQLITLTALGVFQFASSQIQAQEPDVDGTWIEPFIDTSQWSPPSSPPSPDPSGLAYDPSVGRLIITDGEVDEMTIFNNANLFEATLSGGLQATANITAVTNEPAGVACCTSDGHRFISDDVQRKIFEITPEGTLIRSFSTSAFGSNDPEGIAFDAGEPAIYIADGSKAEVYKVTPGADGFFDGISDVVTHFDTESQGILDPEGIEFEQGTFPGGGRLYVVGEPVTRVAQMYAQGPLIRYININAPNPDPRKPAGLAAAPGSLGDADPTPGVQNVYVAARGVDNDTDPNENDGKIYEFSVAALPANPAPAVTAGPDQVILEGASVALDGTVVDEGSMITSWSQISGPPGGVATFVDPNAVDTSASFSVVGDYVLQLTATESGGGQSGSDQIAVAVQPPTPPVKTVYISTKANGTAGGVTYKDEDIIKCVYNAGTCTWSMFADFSDVNVSGDIDAFHLMPPDPITGLPSILFSLDADTTMSATSKCMPGVTVDDSDIIRFIPTSLGSSTDGTCEWYFDGSDVGLEAANSSAEDVDAIGFTSDGKLVISTTGSPVVTCTGCPSLKDEDLLVFTGSAGEETSGTWGIYFDGSDVGLSTDSTEDVSGIWIDGLNNIYLTTTGAFSVLGASGDGDDVFRCVPGSTGSNTTCTYNFTWDGIGSGLLPASGSTTPPVLDGLDVEL